MSEYKTQYGGETPVYCRVCDGLLELLDESIEDVTAFPGEKVTKLSDGSGYVTRTCPDCEGEDE